MHVNFCFLLEHSFSFFSISKGLFMFCNCLGIAFHWKSQTNWWTFNPQFLFIVYSLVLHVQVYETHARLALEVGDLPEYNQVSVPVVENHFLSSFLCESLYNSFITTVIKEVRLLHWNTDNSSLILCDLYLFYTFILTD